MDAKDYRRIARALYKAKVDAEDRNRYTNEADWLLDDIGENLAQELAEDNPQFDRVRFLRAVGMNLGGY